TAATHSQAPPSAGPTKIRGLSGSSPPPTPSTVTTETAGDEGITIRSVGSRSKSSRQRFSSQRDEVAEKEPRRGAEGERLQPRGRRFSRRHGTKPPTTAGRRRRRGRKLG